MLLLRLRSLLTFCADASIRKTVFNISIAGQCLAHDMKFSRTRTCFYSPCSEHQPVRRGRDGMGNREGRGMKRRLMIFTNPRRFLGDTLKYFSFRSHSKSCTFQIAVHFKFQSKPNRGTLSLSLSLFFGVGGCKVPCNLNSLVRYQGNACVPMVRVDVIERDRWLVS